MSINPLFLGEIDDERGDINDLEYEISTTSKLTARPSSSIVAQIKPSLMKELLDPGIRDPKESLNWDEYSIDIEFLELIGQGRIVGYLNW
ncbi:hypothetical protein RIR_jg4871.t1 [Rhizophagus irregularis DAOM 181602=DAOM 197198]|nr:hypothetical protein RIR_jg4871.t1 [Rhizophagus irregularis DAOM 181602=DAOM 197198]CAB5101927.1 unnamed protein product [Rhizophagus irregularis]CAG8495279.1 2773_t:CDS:2 [Rhizophagus irregularis]